MANVEDVTELVAEVEALKQRLAQGQGALDMLKNEAGGDLNFIRKKIARLEKEQRELEKTYRRAKAEYLRGRE